MIDITIKTLDSLNHHFSVQDDLTVKKFKEQIATEVNVPAESQRLIYCGRVLVDEKKLAEYDVHGKVIHLVQRAPPSTSSDTGNSGGESRTQATRNITLRPFNHALRLDGANGNAMYLGAMAFPADLMDAQGITMPQPRHGLSQGRLTIVRMMLRRARYALQNLENPTHQESPNEAANTVNANSIDHIALVAQALSDAVSRATGNIFPHPLINIEVAARRVDPGSGDQPASEEAAPDSSSGTVPEDLLSSSGAGSDPLAPIPIPVGGMADGATADGSTNTEASSSSEPNTNEPNASANGNRNNHRFSGTGVLADIISQVREINRRLQPSLDRYHDLMRDDPVLENPAEAQRLFNQVSELMHYMSHAYHAISDIICDFNQQPPRLLRCRPVLIQHSAVLQTGIPIQFNLGSQNGSQSRGTGTTTTTNATESERDDAGNAIRLTGSVSFAFPSGENQSSTSSSETTAAGESGTNTSTGARATAREAEPRVPPVPPTADHPGVAGIDVDIELIMEDIQNVEETVQAVGSLLENRARSRRLNVPGGPEFVQNFMQFLDGMSQTIDGISSYLGGNGPQAGGSSQPNEAESATATPRPAEENGAARASATAPEETPSSSQTSSESQTEANTTPPPQRGGIWTQSSGTFPSATINLNRLWSRNEDRSDTSQSNANTQTARAHIDQVWSSTETWPTTSTNTRSTTRPHVHISPGFQAMGPGYFDPFLPCNSHHIRNTRRRTQSQEQSSTTQQTSSTSTTTTSANTEPEAAAASGGASAERSGSSSEDTRNRHDDLFRRLNRMDEESRPNIGRGIRMVQGERLNQDNTYVFHIPNRRPFPLLSPFLRIVQESNHNGPNLVSDLITTLARNVRLLDFWAADTRQILTSLRPSLTHFVREILLGGQEANLDTITVAVNRIVNDVRPAFVSFQEWFHNVRTSIDIDIVNTLNQLHLFHLPIFINDILNQDESAYLRDIPLHLTEYVQNLLAIIDHLGQPGQSSRESVESAFVALGTVVLVSIPGLEASAKFRMFRELRSFTNSFAPPPYNSAPIQRFIIRSATSSASPPPASTTSTSNSPTILEILIPSSSRQTPPAPPQQATPPPPDPIPPVVTPQPPPPVQPMEVEDPFVEAVPTAEQIAEPLPDVIIGAEQWHNHVPPDWVPIITRDRERQRRQAAQGPLSEAYLSGMPSKRRKVVSSSKPNSNLARVISESMTTAMGAAGVSPVESVAESAGSDTTLRSAYKEQVRTTVEAKLRSHPDYTPEKYPNAAKLFGPK